MNLITEFSYYVMILALNCVLSSDEEEEGALGVVVCANSLERNALSLTLDFGLGKLFFFAKISSCSCTFS